MGSWLKIPSCVILVENSFVIQVLKKVKNRINRYWVKFPRRVQCNVCNWQGRRLLSDAWHPYTICPNCGSQVRHRLMIAAMNFSEPLSKVVLIKNKKVLHFAPEPQFMNMLKMYSNEYLTADFMRDDVDLKLDMCDMGNLADNSYDLIIACDVLEHVSNDSEALNELFRVLRPQGWAIITVPQKDGLTETYEDVSITTATGRLEAFGQEDHLRIYGENFPNILESHHFDVTTIDEQSFDNDMVKRKVLFPPVLSSHPLATNYRKVFFAQKPS